MNLCVSDREECESGVGSGENGTLLSDTVYSVTDRYTTVIWSDRISHESPVSPSERVGLVRVWMDTLM
jgi:hypothetical protein